MALKISSQYLYTGRGPFDAKALVKTYESLLLESTWLSDDGKNTAYNGMIVAVWLNTADPAKNGVYYLHDSKITSSFKAPDVTDSANWHKLAELSELAEVSSRLQTIENDLSARIKELEDTQPESFESRDLFPEEGIINKIYIALDEQKSYVWEASTGYICISGSSSEMPEIQIICGGTAAYIVE